MIKRTPQEIADFFQGYIAMNENGYWYFYDEEPCNNYKNGWLGKRGRYIDNLLIKNDENIDWKDSLCKPNTDLGIESDIHSIADYYNLASRLQLLMEECAELSVEASHFIRGKGNTKAMVEEMADVEIVLEQIKYLMGIKHKEILDAKKAKVERQLDRIAKEFAVNPQIVREKSTDKEKQE